ncbi:MAG: nucleotidyl transferase AbiEii/AbiGii toxin family protein [Phycisphaerales bacterium]|nr:nucleotidyl transferase AbiEii/AbiGii toxin family protein [Phycisphaerales bacterium]
MTSPVTNMSASVHHRIKNCAAKSDQSFNDLLQHFALERFMYRLCQSRHADQFVLKGALLLRVWRLSSTRSTRDIDLLGRTDNTPESIGAIFREVCCIAVDDDGLIFDSESVRTDSIAADAEYQGLRVTCSGTLCNARVAMQVDIGFGDIITPAAKMIEYPTMLDMKPPRILAYPPETSIAEKFHVILQRGVLNSRMKDFFDLWALASDRSFDGVLLSKAVATTCEHRSTPVEPQLAALSDESIHDPSKQVQWAAFRRRLRTTDAPEKFTEVASIVAGFLGPVAQAVARNHVFDLQWQPGGPWS